MAIQTFTDRLLAAGVLSRVQAADAGREAARTGADVTAVMVQAGYCSADDISRARALADGLPFVDLRAVPVDPDAVALVPGEVARRARAMPVRRGDELLMVAVTERSSRTGNLARAAGLEVSAVLASPPALDIALRRWYPVDGDAPPGPPPRRAEPSTVLATEVVAGAAWADAVGTEPWQRVLAHVRQSFTRQVAARRGVVVDVWGDTAMARFLDPRDAVACSRRVVEVAQDSGVDLRVALHLTDVETERGHPAGLDVALPSQLASIAGPGEVLLTAALVGVLDELAVFERGTVRLAGTGTVPVFALG